MVHGHAYEISKTGRPTVAQSAAAANFVQITTWSQQKPEHNKEQILCKVCHLLADESQQDRKNICQMSAEFAGMKRSKIKEQINWSENIWSLVWYYSVLHSKKPKGQAVRDLRNSSLGKLLEVWYWRHNWVKRSRPTWLKLKWPTLMGMLQNDSEQ
jgi:hypothetical protein